MVSAVFYLETEWYFSLRDGEAEFNDDVSILLRLLTGLTVLSLAVSCNLFHPARIADGPFFIVERELTGSFTGRRLIFNAFDSLVMTADVKRICEADVPAEKIRCLESIRYSKESTGKTEDRIEQRSFVIPYRYDTDKTVSLDYEQDGLPANPLRIFRGGESRGAAIHLYGDSVIPLSDVKATVAISVIREEFKQSADGLNLPEHYIERRSYTYLGIPFGSEQTEWKRSMPVIDSGMHQ